MIKQPTDPPTPRENLEHSYMVTGTVREIYFVHAMDAEEAKSKIETGALVGTYRPSAWETISVECEEIKTDG